MSVESFRWKSQTGVCGKVLVLIVQGFQGKIITDVVKKGKIIMKIKIWLYQPLYEKMVYREDTGNCTKLFCFCIVLEVVYTRSDRQVRTITHWIFINGYKWSSLWNELKWIKKNHIDHYCNALLTRLVH